MNQKKTANTKRISFLCDPEIYDYIQAAGKALYRPQSLQINYLLALALELQEEDFDVRWFRKWLRKYKADKVDQKNDVDRIKEAWLRKQLEGLGQEI